MTQIPYASYQEELVSLRRYFHIWPELSLEEEQTADYIYQYLQGLGLKPERVGQNGVVAMVWAPEEIRYHCETVAVRAEMDALPVQEENDVPWKSQYEGVMHACGHDGILAVGLVLAKICVRYQYQMPVNVKFIFQPAEENGKGTQMMLDAGVMENPHVSRFLMYHFVNDMPMGLEIHRGPSTAAIGSVQISVKGKAAHWSSSEQGIDAIYAAARIVEAFHDVNRTYKGKYPFIAGIGMMHGGKAKNVVANETVLQGTLRSTCIIQYGELRKILLQKMEEIARETGAQIVAEIDEDPIPPIFNDKEMTDLGIQVGRAVWGEDCRPVKQLYLSGDSAAYYFQKAKGLFMVFTAEKTGEENHPLHNGKFDFYEAVLWRAVETLHQFLLHS
ncbi:MAG: M20 family metallopeptidase [Oliverpabstia sp.]